VIAVIAVGAVVLCSLALYLTIHSGALQPVETEPAYAGLPDRVHADDVDDLKLRTAIRGYRMDEVDEVIGRLQAALREAENHAASAAGSVDGDAAL
jgi:DivIVA domain-containing protein